MILQYSHQCSPEYSQLKNEVMLCVGASERHDFLLDSLKELFKDDINSPRGLERITTIGQLLKVLEKRDVLSEENVEPLRLIALRITNNGDLLRKITEYESNPPQKEHLQNYGSENKHETSSREPINSSLNSNPYGATISKRKKDLIQETLVEELGKHWKDLARKLKIRERKIDEIDRDNQKLAEKITKLLEAFEHKANPQSWFVDLCDALEKARRKDLRKSLQEIIVMNI